MTGLHVATASTGADCAEAARGGLPETCSECRVQRQCLVGKAAGAGHRGLIEQRPTRLLRRHDYVYYQQERCHAIFSVRSGSVKASSTTVGGSEHVLGFYLPGDIIGLDGLAEGHYQCSLVAMEHTSVCTLPLERLQGPLAEDPALSYGLLVTLVSNLNRDQQLRMLCTHRDAERRVGGFLLSWSKRLHAIGCSATELPLPMSRHDIGSYLGMTQETVSRMFASLRDQGLVRTKGKYVSIVEPQLLLEHVGAELAA